MRVSIMLYTSPSSTWPDRRAANDPGRATVTPTPTAAAALPLAPAWPSHPSLCLAVRNNVQQRFCRCNRSPSTMKVEI